MADLDWRASDYAPFFSFESQNSVAAANLKRASQAVVEIIGKSIPRALVHRNVIAAMRDSLSKIRGEENIVKSPVSNEWSSLKKLVKERAAIMSKLDQVMNGVCCEVS